MDTPTLTYAQKLQTRRWILRREEILRLRKYRCEECQHSDEGGAGLEVHHVCYVRGKEPWEYPDELLKCLCRECHENRQVHDEDAQYQFALVIAGLPSWQVYELSKQLRLAASSRPAATWFDAYSALRGH